MALAAALLLIRLGEDPPPAPRPIPDNHTATVLVEKAPALGVDFFPTKEGDQTLRSRPSEAGAWMEEQLKVPDDSIGKPSSEFEQYLADQSDSLDAIVNALETASPTWKVVTADSEFHPVPDLLPSLRLQRVLLAASLVAARRGDSLDAERFLEASWSLARPNEESDQVIRQLMAIASGRWQAGVLRKLHTVSPMWISRLSEARSWEATLAAWEHEMKPSKAETSLSADPWNETYRKAFEAVRTGLRKAGPCESAGLTGEALWEMVQRELPITTDDTVAQERKILFDIAMPNLKNAFDRAGRLAVDRELTLEIIRLRQTKEQDPDERWPERMANSSSTVCPAFSYAYRSNDAGMEIRFDGTLVEPTMPFILPLTFRSAYPKREATTPEATPLPTPTPTDGATTSP